MRKINLEQKIFTIKGEPIKNAEKKFICIRDYLLTILGTRFLIESKKEAFWTTELGILCADEKNKTIEIADDKATFLQRIVENNKAKQQTPTGEKEIEIFFPFEKSQLLQALMTDKEKEEYGISIKK